MPKIPGMHNGGVPPNLKWDPNNPPLKNLCSNLVGLHDDNCDGHCGKEPITELECELLNEFRNWARIGMATEHVRRDVFRIGNQIQAVINVLKEMVGEDKLNDEFKRCTLDEMRSIRAANEDAVKKARLAVPKPRLLGPDGRDIA